MVPVASSSDSVDSYDGDDARRFHHEWNAAVNHYSETTWHNAQLEFALNASQVALSAMEAEANMVLAQLAESDARVVGKIFNIQFSFDASIFYQSSNGFLRSFIFGSDVATGRPPVGGKRCIQRPERSGQHSRVSPPRCSCACQGGGPSWRPSRCYRRPDNSLGALGSRSSPSGAWLPRGGEPR